MNKAIRFYDQVEVIPIYNTFLIFMNMICGAVILDEYKMYSVGEMLFLFLSLCTSVCGIFMLVKKPDLKACCKSKTKKVSGSLLGNNSISNSSFEAMKGDNNDLDAYEQIDILSRRTRASSATSGDESWDL